MGSRLVGSFVWVGTEVTPGLRQLLSRSLRADVEITNNPNGRGVLSRVDINSIVKGVREPRRLSKLSLRLAGQGMDLSQPLDDKVALSNAIANAVSRGHLKDLDCPFFVLAKAKVDDRWDTLRTLSFAAMILRLSLRPDPAQKAGQEFLQEHAC